MIDIDSSNLTMTYKAESNLQTYYKLL